LPVSLDCFAVFFFVLFVPYIASFSGLFLYCFSSSCLYPMLPVSLDCPLLIVLSVFSNVYIQKYNWLIKR
jgi:hypothetical protein